MISKKERHDAEKAARQLYQDVLKVDVKEDSDDESSLRIIITRGVKMPEMRLDRNATNPVLKVAKKG